MRPYAVKYKWPKMSEEAVDALILYTAMGFLTLVGVCLFLNITPQQLIAAIVERI